MDLAARKKKQQKTPKKTAAKPTPAPVPETQDTTYSHTITVRYSALLYTTLQNMISSAHMANDFTYTSVADVVRAAIQEYKDGMELTEPDEAGEKKQTSIRISPELNEFYKSWPNQMRTKILERVIRTFLKKQ